MGRKRFTRSRKTRPSFSRVKNEGADMEMGKSGGPTFLGDNSLGSKA